MKVGSKSCGKQHVQFKLIMLDKNMPILDGVDAAVIINDWRKNGKVPKETKLVLITGDETIVFKEFDKRTFDYVIMKPVDRSIIEKIIIDAKLL
jgi:DNA-binding LytR/AlgR family response regulator